MGKHTIYYIAFLSLLIAIICIPQQNLLNNTNSKSEEEAPINPDYYSMEWRIFTTEDKLAPPIDDTNSKDIRLRGTGKTYYDWSKRSMLEIYNDFCIPIFQNPTTDFNFQCHFLNVGEKVYLRVFNVPTRPPCCLFAEDFHPPLPTFAVDNKLPYNSTISIAGEEADYWSMNIPPPGPFWYGWYKNKIVDGYRVPAAFAFLTVSPEDWTSQNFFNFKHERPPQSVFDIPEECQNPEPCVVFPPELVSRKLLTYTKINKK